MKGQQYRDDDFVYVDPDTKEIIGLVEWTAEGAPLSRQRPEPPASGGDADRRKRRLREGSFPWGTLRTMSRMFKLKGVMHKDGAEDYISLDDAVRKANEEPFWD